MAQFKPFRWINLLTWSFVILSVAIAYHQTINFPSTLRTQIARTYLLFNF